MIKSSNLYNYKEFTGIIQKVLQDNKSSNRCKATNTIRYCNQKKFDIVLYGDHDISLLTSSEKLENTETDGFKRMNILPSIEFSSMKSQAVCVKGQIYVFGAGNYSDSKLLQIKRQSIEGVI